MRFNYKPTSILYVIICQLTTFLFLLTGCFPNSSENQSQYTNIMDGNRMLIVLSAPSVNDSYYQDVYQQIIDFQVAYANTIIGNDNVVIVADEDTMPLLKSRVPNDVLLEESLADIWMRDFTIVIPNKPIRFKYRPSYFEFMGDAIYIQNAFERFANRWDLQYQKTDLVIDGGNIVDNNKDMVITTERFLEDNRLSISEAKDALKLVLGTEHVAIIPYDDEVLGHADGMVMFADENTVLVNRYDEPFRTEVLAALRDGLPEDIEIVEVEAEFDFSEWDGFASACGINLNATVTNEHIYVPVFGTPNDDQTVELIASNTTKFVHEVNAEDVCFMGGSVRCLSWQLEGENALRLIEAARNDDR